MCVDLVRWSFMSVVCVGHMCWSCVVVICGHTCWPGGGHVCVGCVCVGCVCVGRVSVTGGS